LLQRTLMKRAAVLLLVVAACDLPELNQPMGDAASVDGASAPDVPDLPDPADAAPDAFDDPSLPDGAQLGSCDPATWTASASDSHPVNPPSYAIDGLLPSRWSTGAPQAPGQYFELDFGGFVLVEQVKIEPVFQADGRGDYPHGMDVLVSYDGIDYSRRLASVNYGGADPGTATIDFSKHAARYLRLELTQGVGNWWSIHELHIGCSLPNGETRSDAGPLNDGPDGGFVTNRSGWTATGSPTEGANPVGQAFDGNASSRWATGKTPQYGDEVFRLDLGQVIDVSGLELRAVGGDYPSAYLVEISTDDAGYTQVAQGLGSDVTSIAFRRQPARYLRIKQIGAGYEHWWGINEINVVQ
jgi:F5/8 type C domain